MRPQRCLVTATQEADVIMFVTCNVPLVHVPNTTFSCENMWKTKSKSSHHFRSRAEVSLLVGDLSHGLARDYVNFIEVCRENTETREQVFSYNKFE